MNFQWNCTICENEARYSEQGEVGETSSRSPTIKRRSRLCVVGAYTTVESDSSNWSRHASSRNELLGNAGDTTTPDKPVGLFASACNIGIAAKLPPKST